MSTEKELRFQSHPGEGGLFRVMVTDVELEKVRDAIERAARTLYSAGLVRGDAVQIGLSKRSFWPMLWQMTAVDGVAEAVKEFNFLGIKFYLIEK